MRKILIPFLLLLSCQAFSQVQEYTLSNGLKVLVKEDHRAPIAVSMVWYKVGSSDEPGGITGVSHAIEHMMFKGTPQYPQGVFSKTIASLGGQDNAFTNTDYTAFYEKIHTAGIPTAFAMEADRMRNLLLDKEAFSKEIKVIQEERRLRVDDNPQAVAFERFLATAHLSAPYNHPVIGWMSDLKQMQVEDIRRWYKRYYAPDNATLVVVGDVDPEKIHQLAQQYFGSIQPRPIKARKPEQEPPGIGEKSITINAPAKLPVLLLGYTVPSVKTSKKPWEPYALELITGILDAGEGARFAKNLIRGKQVATGVETYYNLYSQYQTQFIVYGSPSQKHSVNDLKQALQQELHQLKTKPIDDKELQRIKTQIIAQKTFEQDSVFGQAMELGLLETVGLSWKHSTAYNQAIQNITPAQIQEAAKAYFNTNNRTQALLKPLK